MEHDNLSDAVIYIEALSAENKQLRSALRRAHMWLSTSGMDATPAEIEAECATALGLITDGQQESANKRPNE